jgi:DNA invertase Pin-like site-specific DNA recombinase
MTWASYSRVSSDGQAGLDKYGLERQDSANERYVRSQGFPGEILKFRDVISGTKESRTDFEKLLAAARAGKVRRVVIPDPSRLAREVFVGVALVFELWNAGLEVHHTKRGLLDRDSGDSRRDFITDLVRADADRENLTTQMYEGKLEKVRQGKTVAPLNCYGWNNGVIDEHERSILEWAAHQALRRGLDPICKELNARGEPPPGYGTRWHHTTLRQMLLNPVYIGIYQYGRKHERITVNVPPLLEPELFHAVRHALESRHKGQRPGSRRDVFDLQGRIRCAVCRGAMSGYSNGTHKYYFCRNTLLKQNRSCTHRTYYPIREIHETVKSFLTSLEHDNDALERAIPSSRPSVDPGPRRTAMLAELERAERLYMTGRRDLEWLNAQEGRIRDQLSTLETAPIAPLRPNLKHVKTVLHNALQHNTLHTVADEANLTVYIAPGAEISLEIGV